jgi:steroid delta-isomerase-like uncharacterized protein
MIATFGHPRYELVATGDVYHGEEAVRGYFAETRRAFPDQRNELIALHHADDAVIVEVDILGTHLGPLRAFPPTGRAFRCRTSAHFIFEDDRLVCERVYFDQLTIMRHAVGRRTRPAQCDRRDLRPRRRKTHRETELKDAAMQVGARAPCAPG